MSGVRSQYTQMFPPKPKWGVNDIPDLTGKVMIVTGGNSGIGKETVKALLEHNAKRSEKAQEAINDLKQATGKEAIFLRLDLGDLHSVKQAAEEFISKKQQLHVLFNSAGVMMCPLDMLTAQGYDLQFGTNVLGHFYFTKLLLPILPPTAKFTPEGKVRVVNMSSSAHYNPLGPPLNLATLKDGPARRKLRNLKTNLTRYSGSVFKAVTQPLLFPASYGALTQLWAGTSPEGRELGGKYLIPWARVGVPYAPANDPARGRDLWAWMEEQIKDM
ncbi:NAD(P)-binding protein [Punctularia strigosozonata HHB-11173 SS5]|uniref:NAD(P)-binding protein n=1 Tax=Punctularia strigosozonata (strain HHB-11173) TaxID=741275 RepID=UPI0004417128|nr:NAD(P)-binding protein [Punctularia strigosozonata HHB-11173 SS5]EIN12452.1 NAD(P)-binding protein [Punctularia strigosozonata HHB-11173 SS5]